MELINKTGMLAGNMMWMEASGSYGDLAGVSGLDEAIACSYRYTSTATSDCQRPVVYVDWTQKGR